MKHLRLLLALALARDSIVHAGPTHHDQEPLIQEPPVHASQHQEPMQEQTKQTQEPLKPSIEAAIHHAPFIFNALHSAMRQWGSSVQHNGLSFFPATIPTGTSLYHGTGDDAIPEAMEWLAFELEHAEIFAYEWLPKDTSKSGSKTELESRGADIKPDQDRDRMEEMTGVGSWRARILDDDRPKYVPGFLQHYLYRDSANRLLYLDGMAAGKSKWGTTDSQDYLLRLDTFPPDGPYYEDLSRAWDLCDIGATHNISGFIRMEAGFEVIQCNFSQGVDFLSQVKKPALKDPGAHLGTTLLEYVRGVSQRYQGIGAGRVALDYSYMVSAFFYPLNLSNPSADPAVARDMRAKLVPKAERRVVRNDVLRAFTASAAPHRVIDWQGIVDMVVGRYAERLEYLRRLAEGETEEPAAEAESRMLGVVNTLLNVYIDYDYDEYEPSGEKEKGGKTPPQVDLAAALARCTAHYIDAAHPLGTKWDVLIDAALRAITQQICSALFTMRGELVRRIDPRDPDPGDPIAHAASSLRPTITALMTHLDWPIWTACERRCAPHEACFVAMFPWGTFEDHFRPRCRDAAALARASRPVRGEGYWY